MSEARRVRWHPADVNSEVAVLEKSPPQLGKISLILQDITVGICADILDHRYWI
jgi:hypothetical protein